MNSLEKVKKCNKNEINVQIRIIFDKLAFLRPLEMYGTWSNVPHPKVCAIFSEIKLMHKLQRHFQNGLCNHYEYLNQQSNKKT